MYQDRLLKIVNIKLTLTEYAPILPLGRIISKAWPRYEFLSFFFLQWAILVKFSNFSYNRIKIYSQRTSQSYLYTMNENPAVEWNKLGNGSTFFELFHYFTSLPVISRYIYIDYYFYSIKKCINNNSIPFRYRFDFCFIIAPVVIFKPDTMVCASAAEINCVTDLELMINLNQIKLISSLYAQFKNLIPFNGTEEFEVFETPKCSKPSSMILSSKNSFSVKQVIAESKTDLTKDSGIDFEIFSANSTNLVSIHV